MQRLLPLAAILAAAPVLYAQCPERVFGTALGTGDDTMFAMQPIGFAFPFGGTTYSNVHVCTNGYVHLSNNGVPAPGAADYSATAAEFVGGSPRIAPLWCDYNILPAANGQVYIDSTPAKCTVTWDNAVGYAGLNVVSGPLQQLQLQLFPSGEVRFFYSANVTNQSTLAAGVPGLCGVSPGLGATLPAAVDLSSGGVTTDGTLFELFPGANSFDLGGQGLHLVPTNPGWLYVAGVPSGCAAAVRYGTGCVDARDSFYEFFGTAAAFDLSGRTITMLRQGNGYLVLDSIPGVYVAPGAGAVQVAAGDDAQQTVALSGAMPVPGGTTASITVCSNGYVTLAATGNGTAYTPVAATWLAFAGTAVGNWHDYNQTIAGSGQIRFEQVGGTAYVTWENVYSHTTTLPERFQIQLDVATGNVTIVFDAMSPGGNAYLTGYSAGGPSPDPGSIDLSTALAATLTVSDTPVAPLSLATNGTPWLGNAAFAFTVTNVPNVVPIGVLFFGDAQLPGINLGIIGAPQCQGWSNANLTSATFPVASGTGSVTLPIPNVAALTGLSLTSQAAAFSAATALGLVFSNGVQFTLGQ
jgi:hypothetical protein